MNWKRFTIITISLLALFPLYKIVLACADGGDPYDEYPSFFAPEVTARPVYIPYYYQSYLKYYDDWYDAPAAERADGNLEEWRLYCKRQVDTADLSSFIYNYSYQDLKTLYYHMEKGDPLNVSPAVKGNAFTKWFIAGKDLEALGYLMHAKQCEPYAVNTDWEQPVKDTAKMNRLIKNSLQLHAAARTDLIKDKYAFQAIRLAFYSRQYARALDLFTQLIGERSSGGFTFVRCLDLKGGILYRLKRKAEAAYCYSKVFDLDDHFKHGAYLCFDWAVGHDISAVLKLCKTDHERAVLHIMNGLHNYESGLADMQAAYALDPEVQGLDIVMTREINKIEERYQQPMLYRRRSLEASSWYHNNAVAQPGTDAYRKEQADKIKYESYIGSLNDFCRKLAAAARPERKSFWQLSSAYLYFVSGDISAFNRQMGSIRSTGLNDKEQDLYQVLQVLYVIRSNKEITPSVEAQLLPQLRSLNARSNGKAFRDVMSTVLTTAYLGQKDTIKAIFTLAKANMDADGSFTDLPGSLLEAMTPEKLEDVKAFAAKSAKTGYERWLLDSAFYTADRLSELEGTKYLRMHQFAKAAAIFRKVSPKLLAQTKLPNPFIAHISDRYELDAVDTGKWYNKLSYAEAMVALEARMGTDAAARFDYATGLFSMTYYGKASDAFTYYRSSTDGMAYFNSDARQQLPQIYRDYYGALEAEQAFIKAASMTADAGLKARCLFMAARCWQKRCPGKGDGYYFDEAQLKAYYENALRNPYFKQLKDGFSATPIFSRATGTCGYFADYVKRKN